MEYKNVTLPKAVEQQLYLDDFDIKGEDVLMIHTRSNKMLT